MPLYWLVYRHNNQISVVIEPGATLIHARMSAGLGGIDQSEFTEGLALPGKWQVPKGYGGEDDGCRYIIIALVVVSVTGFLLMDPKIRTPRKDH